VNDVSAFWQFPLEDGLVVARPDVQGLFLLNGSARLVWEQAASGKSAVDIAQRLISVYGVSPDVADQDVAATLAGWSESLLAPNVSPPDLMGGKPAAALRASSGAASVRIDCVLNGRGFRVLLEAGDLVEEVAPRLEQISVASLPSNLPFITYTLVNADDRVIVFRDGVRIAEEEKTSAARAILLQEMAGLSVPEREPIAILHAGACGTATDCLILAGASHAGKSTLCAALMAGGLYCYSDDSAVIDRHFRVAGMPFPVMLRQSSWSVIERLLPAEMAQTRPSQRWGTDVRFLASNLEGASSPSVPPRALVFVDYQSDAKAEIQPLTALEALTALQQSGFWVEHERESIGEFVDWVKRVGRYKLTYSKIEDAIEAVTALLAV
jgi:hypothetical protein